MNTVNNGRVKKLGKAVYFRKEGFSGKPGSRILFPSNLALLAKLSQAEHLNLSNH